MELRRYMRQGLKSVPKARRLEVGPGKKFPWDGYLGMTPPRPRGCSERVLRSMYCRDGFNFCLYVLITTNKDALNGLSVFAHPATYLFYLLIYVSSVPELAENKIEAGTDPGSLPVPDPSRIHPGFFCRDQPLSKIIPYHGAWLALNLIMLLTA